MINLEIIFVYVVRSLATVIGFYIIVSVSSLGEPKNVFGLELGCT